jgi:diguanylate cyclase (GGDEF)-like protein
VEKLSMIDKLTDLYNESYIRKQLEDEVQRCIYYQRPCAMAFITIDVLDIYSSQTKIFSDDKKIKAAADIIKANIGELDRAARLESGELVIIFPDKNKKKAIEDASNIRTLLLTKVFASEQNTKSIVDVFVGISENPLDGNSARDLFDKSRSRAEWAREKVTGVEAFS